MDNRKFYTCCFTGHRPHKIGMDEKTVKELFPQYKEKLSCDGITLCQNNEYGQEVKHYHLHLKPYYEGIKTMELVKYPKNIKDAKEIYEKIKEN